MIWTFSKLEALALGNFKLTELPEEIGQLTNLTYLDLNYNQLSTVPEVIGQLTNLTRLTLTANQLSILPKVIGQLTNLTSLDLSNNQLNTLPEVIEQLTNLTSLNLSNNQLSTLPEVIGQLTKLEYLYLSNNQLNTLPEIIGQLTNLKMLFLNNNQLSTLPEGIGKLTNLKELYLWSNQLSTLPKVIEQLINLSELYLNNNQLNTLPEEIGKLTNLSWLELNNNQLSTLPERIGQLTNLKILDLNNNKLPIPLEILAYHDKTIIDYYLEPNKTPLNEAKVLLVGEGGVGKTSLVNRLIYNKFNDAENKTEGINREALYIDLDDDRKVKLNVWDFGGQEIMHSTHQFFLTERSLYILVWDARQDDTYGLIERWLKLIESFGSDSPIIVVLNKTDIGYVIELDRRGLQKKYKNIKAFVNTSCKADNDMGIAELKEAIKKEIGELRHIKIEWPIRWFNMKEKLENMDKN